MLVVSRAILEGSRFAARSLGKRHPILGPATETWTDMSFLDAANGGVLDSRTASEMSRLLRTAADLVERLPCSNDVNERVALWRELADIMGTFDELLPDETQT